MSSVPSPLPAVRSVAPGQTFVWLARGWNDLRRIGWLSLAHGLALAAFGAAIVAVAHNRFWLLAGAPVGLSSSSRRCWQRVFTH